MDESKDSLVADEKSQPAEYRSNTMTAPRYPQGVVGGDFLSNVSHAGVTLAGGLHPQIRTQYFRIGHMGGVTIGEILTTLAAIENALRASKYPFQIGAAVAQL